MDSNGSGEAGGQQKSSPSAGSEKIAGKLGREDDWQLREDLMGAFEGALDAGGKRGDLQGIRVLKNDRVMGARAGGGPCFGNCEDDEGAEWVRRHCLRSDGCKIWSQTESEFTCCWLSDHFSGETGQEDQGGRGR